MLSLLVDWLITFFIIIGNTVRRTIVLSVLLLVFCIRVPIQVLIYLVDATKSYVLEKWSILKTDVRGYFSSSFIKKIDTHKSHAVLFNRTSLSVKFIQYKSKWNNFLYSLQQLLTKKTPPRRQKRQKNETEPRSLHEFDALLPHISLPTSQKPIFTVSLTPLVKLQMFLLGIICAITLIIIPFIMYTWLRSLPNPQLLTSRSIEVTTQVLDRNGELLYDIYEDKNRTPVTFNAIPLFVKQATIAIEDKDFYSHSGFSLKGIIRAMQKTFIEKTTQGGSTITQQLIKSALLTSEVNFTRKIREIVLAFWAEHIYSKNQILEMYLNQVPYGGTAWGIEAASQTYFGKSITDVTLAEAALLAGLPQAPSVYSPFGANPEKALERQKEVLRRMVEDGYITTKEAEIAQEEKIHFISPHISLKAPHFVMYVKKILENTYGTRLIERGGLRITTTLDLKMQENAEKIVKNTVDALENLNVTNGSALVTNPKTGEILAMVGSKNYFDTEHDGNVNITTSLRQPGSSIKPITYVAALNSGKFTAASLIDDSPISFNSPGSPPYAPINYDSKFHGYVPFRYALANSYNIPAVKILNSIGLPNMIETAQAMGITTFNDTKRFGLSLTLGGGEVTMLDMATAYGTLANNGSMIPLTAILEVKDYTGHVYESFKQPQQMQAVKPEAAWIISNILADNTARIAAFGPQSQLVIPTKTVSVKTGTTNEKRDNWTIGYTPSFVTTVWVGNNNNAPMDQHLASGITGAAPIWNGIMSFLLQNKEDEVPKMPKDIIAIPCYFGRTEYFIRGSEPKNGGCGVIPTPMPSPTPTIH